MSYLFISHDLSVVRFMSDEVMVLKDGCVVEQGRVDHIIDTPQHEYTRRLIAAVPRLQVAAADGASTHPVGPEPAPHP
jgi:peptide/nickel transport system ATP-binding protein